MRCCLKKSNCDLHATLRQRLTAIDALSGQHSVSILCRVLNVNRSTYYKHLRRQPSLRQQENMEIRKKILTLYAGSDKRLGAKKMKLCLAREYCITISEGRVHRLMKEMNLPKMSTVKPPKAAKADKEEVGACQNLPAQKFDQKAPNLVWISDFTYVKVAGKFFYICAVIDLYARKVIACRVCAKSTGS